MKELFPNCHRMNYSDNDLAGFRLTGNDMVDYGLDTVAVFCRKNAPEELTYQDLAEYRKTLEKSLLAPGLVGQHSVYFTMNFGAINPSAKPENKRDYAEQISSAYLYEPDRIDETCAYCGRPAIIRGFRNLIPMLTGEAVINFYAQGDAGIPVCGKCLLAVLALTTGAPMVSGRMLFLGCSNREIIREFIAEWLRKFLPRLQLASSGGDKLDKIGNPLNRVSEVILNIDRMKDEWQEFDIHVYHLTNSGQGPASDIYHLPISVVRFARLAKMYHREIWREIVKSGQESSDKAEEFPRNYLYDDLFRLPEYAPRFIRTYFLRRALSRGAGKKDPRTGYNPVFQAHLVSWGLVELFLKEVTAMEQVRIDALRNLGDAIAAYLMETDDHSLFGKLFRAGKYSIIRNLLIKISKRQVAKGAAPIITFDGFLNAFEEAEELARIDWHLAWDLVTIRIIESLYQHNWLQKNKEKLAEELEDEETEG
ncbi:MAG: type I-B CRISPR-associated protein Cas8b1/Cst1 [Firmicutes bacterium]|nr:type I-B CRISPR-associated protein Cas8b1/Cst1 [Bacillota bacterium]